MKDRAGGKIEFVMDKNFVPEGQMKIILYIDDRKRRNEKRKEESKDVD